MKIIMSVFAFCFVCSTPVLSQSVLYATTSPVVMYEHPQHATEHSMAPDQNLLGNSAYSYAQGEQPMWEFGSGKIEIPLGDLAREVRQKHAHDKKAPKISTND